MAHSGFSAAGGLASGVARRKPEPPPRPSRVNPDAPPFVLPDVSLDSAEHIAQVSAAAIAAVAAGSMDPRQGTALSQMLERHRRAIETVDHAKRLAELEQALAAKDGAK